MTTYKYKLQDQKNLIELGNLIDDCWHIHCHILKLIKRYWRIYKKYPHVYKVRKHLVKLKKLKQYHWYDVPSVVSSDITDRIDLGYKKFFRYKKNGGRKVGLPKFFKRENYSSMTWPQACYKIEKNRIFIGRPRKQKWYTFYKHRDYKGIIRTVTIKRDKCGDYFLTIVTDHVEKQSLPKTGSSVGIDFGLKTFLTLSDGQQIESPRFFEQVSKDIRKAYKALSRKKKGSNNWYKALRILQRLYRKITRRRADWFWKLAKDLCKLFDIICIEDLNIDGMKRLWGRKVSDYAFSNFVSILERQGNKFDKQIVKIDRFFPSTKLCSKCGHKQQLTLGDRTWKCNSCDTNHDRDLNAAQNILMAGITA